jgi:hypothetical protein
MDDRLKETGRGAYAAISQMVAALDVDYDRLMELREERQALLDMIADAEPHEKADARAELAQWDEENKDELDELSADAGECVSLEEAQTRIQEDALLIEVRSGWCALGDTLEAGEFSILLTTGGPAVWIRGELDDNREPSRAWLEVQHRRRRLRKHSTRTKG